MLLSHGRKALFSSKKARLSLEVLLPRLRLQPDDRLRHVQPRGRNLAAGGSSVILHSSPPCLLERQLPEGEGGKAE